MRQESTMSGAHTGRRATAQAHAYRHAPRADAGGEAYPAWLLEDIEAPEAWSLSSFDDLLPRDVA